MVISSQPMARRFFSRPPLKRAFIYSKVERRSPAPSDREGASMVDPIDISEAVAAAKKRREKRKSAKEAAALYETIDMERVETPAEEDMVAAFDRAEVAAIKATCEKLKATYEEDAFTEDSKGGILAKDPYNTVLAIRKLGLFLRYDQFNGRYNIHGLP